MSEELQTCSLSASFWQQIAFFKNVPFDVVKNLLSGSEFITTRAKSTVFNEGEPAEYFGFVISGFFKLFKNLPANQRAVMDFVTTGGMVAGLLMAAEESVYPVTVQSMTEGRFLKIPKTTYNIFWMNNVEIMKKVQTENMRRVQSLQIMRAAQRKSLEERVAWVLIKVLNSFPEENNYLKVFFSRIDMAEAVGAAPESVIRLFSQWTKEGLIESRKSSEFINLKAINEKFLIRG